MLRIMFNVFLKPKGQKQFNALSAKDQENVLNALEGLREDPFVGKKPQGELHGFHALRVWLYRIIYTVGKRIMTVTAFSIGQRKDMYGRR